MPNKQFLDGLGDSLRMEDSGQRRARWADFILAQKIDIQSLLPLLLRDQKTALRFCSLLGDLAERDPNATCSVVPELFRNRDQYALLNFDRTLAKQLWLCGIPKEIEGEAIDQLFQWLGRSDITVMTKTYSLEALCKVVKTIPELRKELIDVLSDQLGKNSDAFDRKARKTLFGLNR